MALKIEVIESFKEAEPTWRSLEAKGHAFVFQTFDWQATYYQTLGCKHLSNLCLVIVKATDDRPLMLLPLGIVRRRFSRVLIWLGGKLTDYNGPLLANDASDHFDQRRTARLWQQICRVLPKFDYTDFQRQPAHIGDQQNPFWQLGTSGNPVSGWQSSLSLDWNAYYRQKRGVETRRKDRKKEAKLAEHGPIHFKIAQTEEEIDAILETLAAQKLASYAQKGITGVFLDPASIDFIRSFTQARCESGLVVLACLKVRDEIIAAQWGVIQEAHFYCLVLSRDHGRFARYSPGNILLRRLLEWCCAREIKTFDFTYGNEAFKSHWCDSKVELCDSFLSATLRGSVMVCGIRLIHSIRHLARRSSHVYALATRFRKQRCKWHLQMRGYLAAYAREP